MTDFERDDRRWTIISRRDWTPYLFDGLHPHGAPLPEPDDQLEVIEVVPATQLQGTVSRAEALEKAIREHRLDVLHGRSDAADADEVLWALAPGEQ